VVLVVQEELVAQVELEELAASEELAAWVGVLGRRNYLPVAPVAIGSTTRRIAVALPMGIVQLRTDLVVRLGEPRCLIVKRAQGSRLADRVAMWPVVADLAAEDLVEAEDSAEAIEGEELVEREELAEAIEGEDWAEAHQAVETGVHLGVDPVATTDQVHVPTAAEVPPAWDLEVAAGLAAAAVAVVVAVAAVGGGRHEWRT
jgi:hypothetical protein